MRKFLSKPQAYIFVLLLHFNLSVVSAFQNTNAPQVVNSQATAVVTKADSLFTLGKNLHKQRKYTHAIKVLKQAKDLFLEQNNFNNVVSCITRMGVATKFQFKPFQEVENVLRPGLNYVTHKDVKDDVKAWFYLEIANALGEQGKLQDAPYYIDKAYKIVTQWGDHTEETLNIARMVRNQNAGIQNDLHNYQKSEELFLENIAFFKKHGLDQTFTKNILLEIYHKSGQLKKFENLLQEMQESNLIEKESYYNKYMHYYTLTEFFIGANQFDKAEENIENLENLTMAGKHSNHFAKWYIKRMRNEIHLGKKEYHKVIEMGAKMELDASLKKTQLGNLANDFKSQSMAYYGLGDFESASDAVQKSLRILLPEHRKNEEFLAEASYKGLINKLDLAAILNYKGKFLHQLHQSNKDSLTLKMSLHNFEQAHEVLKEIGEESKEDQFLTNEFFKSFYEDALLGFQEAWLKDNDRNTFFRALKISDESRYLTVLNELRASKNNGLFSNIPKQLKQKEEQLQLKIDSLNNGNVNSESKEETIKKHGDLVLELEKLKDRLFKEYPKYYELKYGSRNSLKGIIQSSYADANILEFFWGKDFLFVFQIQNKGVQFDKIPITTELIANKEVLVNSLRRASDNAFKKSGNFIYETVFQKYLDHSLENILIFDDALHFIPIESIWVGKQDSGNFLIDIISVRRLNSIAQNINRLNEEKLGTLLLAPFASYDGLTYQKIKNTKTEVEEIQKLMQSKVYVDSSATKNKFLENADNYPVLHFATHSLVEPENPLKSRILFYDDDRLKPSEKSLTIEELYNLELKAELVVLSACETGIGREIKGRGIASVSNGFNYAGASSTLMSLWKVPDQQTSKIMISFYKFLKEGLPKNKALQKAKMDYLANTDDELLKHPYYWAGFVITGNVDPIGDSISLWWWLAGILFLIFCGVLWLKRKYQSS